MAIIKKLEKKYVEKEYEVKPCPFCGSEDIDIHHYKTGGEGWPTNAETYVKCNHCGASGRVFSYDLWHIDNDFDFYKDAVNAWNHRANETSSTSTSKNSASDSASNSTSTLTEEELAYMMISRMLSSAKNR